MKNQNPYQKYKPLFLHIFCWGLYILYEQTIFLINGIRLSPLYVNASYYTINISLFYLHCYLLSKTAGRMPPAYLKAVLWTLIEITLFLLVKYAASQVLYGQLKFHWHDIRDMAILDLYRSVYFIGMATLLWTAVNFDFFRKSALNAENLRFAAEKERALAETRLAEARSAYYQHQLNPHLLFNSLGFIYQQVHQHSAEASRGVLLLSDILRFSLTEGDNKGRVLLTEELEQVSNIIEINRLRFGGHIQLFFVQEGDPSDFRILPLILLTLTENIFKHGLIDDSKHPVFLGIKISEDGILSYLSRNNKKRGDKLPGRGHTGLKNLRIRLEQAYKDRYSLALVESETDYRVTLIIELA